MTGRPDRLVVLVRHGNAVARTRWAGEDATRPLTARGERQAATLAVDLAEPPPARLVSSPARRCTDTLAPLGHRAAVRLELVDRLAEGSDPDHALAYLLELADGPGTGPVVACSHGDVIDGLVGRLLSEGVPLEVLVGHPVALGTPKGGRWSLTVAGGAVTGGALHGPPGEPPGWGSRVG